MTPDELKAELAQLAAENQRLREAAQQVLTGKDCPFCDALRFRTLDQTHWPECGTLALQDAITPPTPGLGAAMLRVVESAQSLTKWIGWDEDPCSGASGACFISEFDDPDESEALTEFYQAVEALNKLEAKHE